MKAKNKDPKKKNALPRQAVGAALAGGNGGVLSPEVVTFRGDQVKLLAKPGWNCCSSIREGLKKVNLPVPTATYLETAFTSKQWTRAYQATNALRDHFKDARYIDQATFGILLVPDRKSLIVAARLTQPFVAIRPSLADLISWMSVCRRARR